MAGEIRIGIAGKRGLAYFAGLNALPGAKVTAFCELDAPLRERVRADYGIAAGFDDFTRMLGEVDAVVVATPQQFHAAQSIQALQAGVHVLSEVTPVVSLAECWQLLAAAEASTAQYMLAENYCYFRDHQVLCELVRRGEFGDPYFAEGNYIHELRELLITPDGKPTWRATWHAGVRGCTYPTHSIGPVMHWFKAANPAERIAFVTCLGSGRHTAPQIVIDDTCTMLCQLASGRLIQSRFDMLSNRPILGGNFMLQGTRGVFESGHTLGEAGRIWIGENQGSIERPWRPIADFQDLAPAYWADAPESTLAAPHLGGDYFTGWDFVRALLAQEAMPIDIYDALEWTATGLCSQISIANSGTPIRVPDFRDKAARPLAPGIPL